MNSSSNDLKTTTQNTKTPQTIKKTNQKMMKRKEIKLKSEKNKKQKQNPKNSLFHGEEIKILIRYGQSEQERIKKLMEP